ncbi:MAG: hypothetical protein IJV35_08090 [Neisseriaceae bacterium]|nr:hypothetical protein [Neisseriaceae bacterium]
MLQRLTALIKKSDDFFSELPRLNYRQVSLLTHSFFRQPEKFCAMSLQLGRLPESLAAFGDCFDLISLSLAMTAKVSGSLKIIFSKTRSIIYD